MTKARIIAAINQKGGVGKSTTALSLGAGLALRGNKVLFVDMDAQGNLSSTMGANKEKYGTLEVLMQAVQAKDAIQHTASGYIVPASKALASADIQINMIGKEYRLKEALESVKQYFDYIIIDTPPALGILTVNALTACDEVIIPAQADIYSLEGIGQLYETIRTVKQYCNRDLHVKGIVLTRYSARAALSRGVAEATEEMAKRLNTRLFDARIRECIAIKESQAQKQDIFAYAPKSNASIDYNELIDEILKEEN